MSRHAGFFASLQRVEDRLALEEESEKQSSDTMTASSPLVFLDHSAAAATADSSSSGGPALDFLTLTTRSRHGHGDGDGEEETSDDGEDDIDRLMALLGLSPPRERQVHGGCYCSGAGGFRANVVGVVGPKCDGEKRRLDAWIQHLYDKEKKKEPARMAHLLLAKHADADFPATVKEFLDHDAPVQ